MNKPEKIRVYHDLIYPDDLDWDIVQEMLRDTIIYESEKRFKTYSVVGEIYYWREPIGKRYRYFAEAWIRGSKK